MRSLFILLAIAACRSPAAEPNPEAAFLSNTRQLIYDGKRSGEGYFHPDGKRLTFQSERDADNPFYQIYTLDLESGDTRRVSPGLGKTTCSFFRPGSDEVLFDRLGLVGVPKSPLMAGVRTLVAKRAYRSTGRVLHGSQVIAEWAILSRPLIVVGTFGARKVVSLNLFPVPSTAGDDFIAGDLGILLRNALLYR